MTDKEKARAYDEALERARKLREQILNNELLGFPDQFTEIFPQLKENEDERIRKEIISALKFANVGGVYNKHIAYLEKQKPTECIEFANEFENQVSHLLASALNGEYEYNKAFINYAAQSLLGYAKNEMKSTERSEEDEKIRKSLIKDFRNYYEMYDKSCGEPKWGSDNLVVKDILTYLEKQKEQKPVDYEAELKKCKDNPLYFFDKYVSIKQKSTRWSYPYGRNETVDRLVSLAECLEMDGDCLFNECSGTEWGKFLRDLARKQVECKSEWSEEDEKMRKGLINFLRSSFIKENITDETVAPWIAYLERQKPFVTIPATKIVKNEPMKMPSGKSLDALADVVQAKDWKPSEEQKYDGNMDKECIKLCNTLNSIPSVDTFESCCGHLKDSYSVWFFCNDIIAISRLGRCVERNYSDGKWELLVDSTDTHPTGVFWLRSKVPFQSYDEMEESVNELCVCIQYWFNTKFDSYFNDDACK